MPQTATNTTPVKITTARKRASITLQNLHASQHAYYGWGAAASDVSATKSLRLAAGTSVTLNLEHKPVGKELYVVAGGSDTPTVAYDTN